MLNSVTFDKMLRLPLRRSRKDAGYHNPTNGVAAALWKILSDPSTRSEFLRLARVSPEAFRSDEECSRSLTVGMMVADLARMIDAVVAKRRALFEREREMAQMLRGIDADGAERSAWEARIHAVTADLTRASTRQIGLALERDFGVRAAKLAAEMTTVALELSPPMTERQARRMCGWNHAKPPKLLL